MRSRSTAGPRPGCSRSECTAAAASPVRSYFGPGAVVVGIDVDPERCRPWPWLTRHDRGSGQLIASSRGWTATTVPSTSSSTTGTHHELCRSPPSRHCSRDWRRAALHRRGHTHTPTGRSTGTVTRPSLTGSGSGSTPARPHHDPDGDADSPLGHHLGAETPSSIRSASSPRRPVPAVQRSRWDDRLPQTDAASRTARVADLEQQRADLAARLEEVETNLGRMQGTPPAAEADEVRALRASLRDSRRDLRELAGRLARTRDRTSSTQGRLLDAWEHIRRDAQTVSWRITTPLRAVGCSTVHESQARPTDLRRWSVYSYERGARTGS